MIKQRHVWGIAIGFGLYFFGGGIMPVSLLQAEEPNNPLHLVVTDQALPFRQVVVLKKNSAARVTLPNGKDIAFWCGRGALGRLLSNSDLDLEWGEKPFTQLRAKWKKQADGSQRSDGWYSYIRQGGVTTYSSKKTTERELFVEKYRVVLADDGDSNGTLPVTVEVRLATKQEMLFGSSEIEHYLNQLKSPTPAERLEAITKIRDEVSLGNADYSDNLQVIINGVRPLVNDPDPGVREATNWLMPHLGDSNSILALVTPEPKGFWRTVSGAWELAQLSTHYKTDGVAKQVYTFFDSSDDSLVLFATAFFARTGDPMAKSKLLAQLKSGSPKARSLVADALRVICTREEAATSYVALLKDDSKEVVIAALNEASWLNDKIPSKEIVQLLSNKDPQIREAAVHALDCCRNPEVVAPLLVATKDDNARVRAAAAVTLGRIANPRAYDRLCEMLEDDVPEVRMEAINGLRWLQDGRAIAVIQKRLEKENSPMVKDMGTRTIRELRLLSRRHPANQNQPPSGSGPSGGGRDEQE